MVGTDRWAVHSFAAPDKIGCQLNAARKDTVRSRGVLIEGNEGFNLGNVFVALVFFCRIPLWGDDRRRFLQKAEPLAVKIPACRLGSKSKFRHALVQSTGCPKHPFGVRTVIGQRPADLKCRCDYFQVLSRRLALAGSRQSTLDEPIVTRLDAFCVKRCGLISLNTLQGRSQGGLVRTGCLHCQGANPNNCCNYQRCRDQPFGDAS